MDPRSKLEELLEVVCKHQHSFMSGAIGFVFHDSSISIGRNHKELIKISMSQIMNIFVDKDIFGNLKSLVICTDGGACITLPDGLIKLKEGACDETRKAK